MGRVVVHFDGASVSTGGQYHGGWGYTIEGEGMEHEGCGRVAASGQATNNVAEYTAILEALEFLRSRGYQGPVRILGDSQLVVRQFSGEYQVRAPHLKPHHQKLLELASSFSHVEMEWVPRELNQRADALSKRGLTG